MTEYTMWNKPMKEWTKLPNFTPLKDFKIYIPNTPKCLFEGLEQNKAYSLSCPCPRCSVYC